MKCDMCETDAILFLTKIMDGKMTQVKLCDKCSKEKGLTDPNPSGFQIADFLLERAAELRSSPSPPLLP